MSGAAIGDIAFLEEATVERHLDHDALIEAMERAFVGSVGWNTREGRELDDATMRNIVIVESGDAALDQSGKLVVAGAEILAAIDEIP